TGTRTSCVGYAPRVTRSKTSANGLSSVTKSGMNSTPRRGVSRMSRSSSRRPGPTLTRRTRSSTSTRRSHDADSAIDQRWSYMGVIVVGVDFSEGSKAALRFGLAEAKLRQATLRAVHAWKIGYTGVPGFEGFYPITGFEP